MCMFWPCQTLNLRTCAFEGGHLAREVYQLFMWCCLAWIYADTDFLVLNLSCLLLCLDAPPCQLGLQVCRGELWGKGEMIVALLWRAVGLLKLRGTAKYEHSQTGGLFQCCKTNSGNPKWCFRERYHPCVSCWTNWYTQENADKVLGTWFCVIKRSALNEWAWSKGGKNRNSHLSIRS